MTVIESELQHLLQTEDRTKFLEIVSVLVVMSVLIKLAVSDYNTALLHARFGQIYSSISEQRISHVTYYAQHGEWPDDEKRAVSAGASETKVGGASNESGMSQIEKIRQWQSLGTLGILSVEQRGSSETKAGGASNESGMSQIEQIRQWQSLGTSGSLSVEQRGSSESDPDVGREGAEPLSAGIGSGDAKNGEAEGKNAHFLIVGSVNFKMGPEFSHGRGIPVLGFRPVMPVQDGARVMRFVCGNDSVPASADVSGPNLTNLRQVDLTYVCRGKR